MNIQLWNCYLKIVKLSVLYYLCILLLQLTQGSHQKNDTFRKKSKKVRGGGPGVPVEAPSTPLQNWAEDKKDKKAVQKKAKKTGGQKSCHPLLHNFMKTIKKIPGFSIPIQREASSTITKNENLFTILIICITYCFGAGRSATSSPGGSS